MKIAHPLLRAIASVVLILATTVSSQEEAKCRHGLTANDIAASSGLDLTGKVALVTGGRSGLGFAITEALLRQNCTVVIASRDEELNIAAVEKLRELVSGANVSYQIFDLEEFSSVRSLATEFISSYDRLDYYFGNAGQGDFQAQPLTVDGYERIFQVNYVAQFLLVHLLLPILRKGNGPSRVVLTASSTHSLACGDLGLSEDCFGDGSAISKLPFDQAGLDAIGNTFLCPPIYSSYPTTKFLLVQLARELTKREAEAGNKVLAYAWAPGNINTALNPWASCCIGPYDNVGESCRYQLPYVGPKHADGSPNPPSPPVTNHWTSPAHGAMAALYSALKVDPIDAGQFYASYWKCEAEKGYFDHGITSESRSEIFDLSKVWAGIDTTAEPPADDTSSGTILSVQWGVLQTAFFLLCRMLL